MKKPQFNIARDEKGGELFYALSCPAFLSPDKKKSAFALVLTDPPYGNGNGVAQAHYDQYGDEWARLCRRAKRMQLSYSR